MPILSAQLIDLQKGHGSLFKFNHIFTHMQEMHVTPGLQWQDAFGIVTIALAVALALALALAIVLTLALALVHASHSRN